MAGLTPSLQQQQQQQQHHLLTGSAVSGTSATPGEEDAFKRNTDCVYFLASPLTCKKGSECEYRHSEIARLNPRDCYYWMNGNCLNPKCGFRHPPLEGLLGAQAPTPVGASVPPSLAASTPVAPASFGPGLGKQPVPCIFFQKGYCMKGDWCPFLHAPPNSVSNKVLPSQAPATTAEPPNLRKPFGGLEKVTQQKMPPQVNVPKAVELPSQAKPTPRVGYAPSKDEPSKERKHPASSVGDELSRQRSSGVPSFDNGTHVSWSSRVQQPVSLIDNVIIMNGKDAEEEISREPSPGFDVLVDNELEDSAYYPSEDQFGRPDEREGGNDYFDRHSGDYKSMVDTEPRGYDSYERHQGQYAWEQRRSSERMLSGLPVVNREKSRRSRTRSPDPVHDSDLRYRLSKHSRTSSGLRSVIHQDDAHERPDHRSYQKSQRDVHRDHERRDNSLGSSRLRGRIKMPGQSSSDIGNELQRSRNTDWPRPQTGGLSQGRFQHPSRLQNRIKDAVGVEDGHNNYRNDRSLIPIRRETRNDADFAPPKRLSELRSRKTVETNDQHVNHQTSDSKRKHSKVEYPQDVSGDHLSFDGPKPLQEILKRKRVNEKSDSGSSDGNLYNNRNKTEESLMNHADKASEQQTENAISKSASSGVNKIEKESAALLTDEAEVGEVVGEMMVEDGEVGGGDEEAENYAAEDDVEYYEQVDGEEEAYELDEGDNGGDPEGEYLDEDDDDDDDDFAKKMGVMY